MGIKELYSILLKKHPNVFIEENLNKFQNKIIAVDILTFLYKYVRYVGEDGWINMMLLLFYKLQKNNIKIICIFDGKNYPVEKNIEKDIRVKNMQKNKEKYIKVQNLRCKILKEDNSNNENQIILKEYIQELGTILKRTKINEKIVNSIPKFLKELEMIEKRLKNQCMKITETYYIILKDMLDCFNIPVITADGDGEKLCSFLCIKGIVDAVLSEDSDVLVYGTPLSLFKINLRKNTIITVDNKVLLKEIELTLNEFKDFCIMCGCDYNMRIKIKSKTGKRDTGIGSNKAYKLIKEYKTIDNINEKLDVDVSSLNYIRCREIFSFSDFSINYDITNLKFAEINYNKLDYFLNKYNCKYNVDIWENIEQNRYYINILEKINNINIKDD